MLVVETSVECVVNIGTPNNQYQRSMVRLHVEAIGLKIRFDEYFLRPFFSPRHFCHLCYQCQMLVYQTAIDQGGIPIINW